MDSRRIDALHMPAAPRAWARWRLWAGLRGQAGKLIGLLVALALIGVVIWIIYSTLLISHQVQPLWLFADGDAQIKRPDVLW